MDLFTERDWLTSTDAHAMLDHLFPVHGFHSTPVQPRKLRLYYLALVRRWADRLPPAAQSLIRFADSLADGRRTTNAEIAEVSAVAERLATSGGSDCLQKWSECERQLVAFGLPILPMAASITSVVAWTSHAVSLERMWPLVLALQTEVPPAKQLRRAQHDPDLLREIYGNPFDAPILTGWRSADVIGIARNCYECSDFHTLPILADALVDAGCPDDHAVVRHCREEPLHTHVRGCWALDAILLQ